ncbi:MAG: hypothetical protein OTJ97_05715 [SAR202 cluster bacterium]|nr:hypothetical protein [SAR202 cluster bacterium]
MAGLIGGRKQGKSCAQIDLLDRMGPEFDLVLAFVGSAACNPVLQRIMAKHWDPRFFFPEWGSDMIDKLLRQQEEIHAAGLKREVCILVDDVILESDAREQLAHLAMRGRHFRISLIMCAVSYTSLPKRMRRSLDILLVFSVPMRGDMQTLLLEYCQGSASVARFQMLNLNPYECLVLETLMKRQQLFVWKADLLEARSEESLVRVRSKTEGSADSEPESQSGANRTGMPSALDQSRSAEPRAERSASEESE